MTKTSAVKYGELSSPGEIHVWFFAVQLRVNLNAHLIFPDPYVIYMQMQKCPNVALQIIWNDK